MSKADDARTRIRHMGAGVDDALGRADEAHSAVAMLESPGPALRALALARTKLDEAGMWLRRAWQDAER